jgi:hypothetical protein
MNGPKNGVASFNYNKMLSAAPDIVAFNGRPSQYQDAPIRVNRGDRVRFHVVSADPPNWNDNELLIRERVLR